MKLQSPFHSLSVLRNISIVLGVHFNERCTLITIIGLVFLQTWEPVTNLGQTCRPNPSCKSQQYEQILTMDWQTFFNKYWILFIHYCNNLHFCLDQKLLGCLVFSFSPSQLTLMHNRKGKTQIRTTITLAIWSGWPSQKKKENKVKQRSHN